MKHSAKCGIISSKGVIKLKRYDQNETSELAEILKNDGVISVPTDTVFGVCARIASKDAHDNLVKTKNRPHDKLFPIMCADEDQIKRQNA